MGIETFSPGDIPAKPGVYLFRDKFGKIIYIGKAVNLRKRVSQYFQPSRDNRANPKFRSLINSIDSYDLHTVANEEEALLLESKLIKEYSPYYNILLRDDKRFLMFKVTMAERFPRIVLARIKKSDGARYFGPFPNGGAVKSTALFLSSYFKLRVCPYADPGEAERKYCMDARVKRCCEPCIGKTSKEKYDEKINRLLQILEGKIDDITTSIKQEMQRYSDEMNFEKAALQRDILGNLTFLFRNKIRNVSRIRRESFSAASSLEDIRKSLGMKNIPETIEAIDISNLTDNFAVASLVVFRGGRPDRKSYRRFKIKTVEGINDFAMIKEVVKRRFRRLIEERTPFPDLLVVDGGKGQLSSALEALAELNAEAFPLIGLAKKNEEIFLPGRSEPVILDKSSSGLNILRALRDEAHRFAVFYNREVRLRKISESVLDDIEEIGTKRKLALLRAFGSIREIRNSSPNEIKKRTGIVNLKLAEKIIEKLRLNH